MIKAAWRVFRPVYLLIQPYCELVHYLVYLFFGVLKTVLLSAHKILAPITEDLLFLNIMARSGDSESLSNPAKL